jgi:hypothetical protein
MLVPAGHGLENSGVNSPPLVSLAFSVVVIIDSELPKSQRNSGMLSIPLMQHENLRVAFEHAVIAGSKVW